MAENCPLVTRADDKKSSYSHTNEGIENWSFGANFNGREGCNSQIQTLCTAQFCCHDLTFKLSYLHTDIIQNL